MIRCMCLVQEGQGPDLQRTSLHELLETFAERAFGQPADVHWVAVPAGGGFTDARPSTSSVVSITSAEPVAQDTRTALLKTLCDGWMEETGCSLNEIVAVINDPQDQ